MNTTRNTPNISWTHKEIMEALDKLLDAETEFLKEYGEGKPERVIWHQIRMSTLRDVKAAFNSVNSNST